MTSSGSLAASVLCAEALRGPRTALTLVHRGREAWLLSRPGHHSTVALVTPRAVLLPPSLLVPDLPSDCPEVGIGAGCLWYDDRPVVVRRWFTPARVVLGAGRTHAAASGRAARLIAGWRHQLGSGEGLTPYGDDILCGLMLGLIAAGDERSRWLAEAITGTDLEARTTAASATLLRCAADGWCIPEVAAVLTALAAGRPVSAALQRLLAVGHSSGRGLVVGLAAVLETPALAVAA